MMKKILFAFVAADTPAKGLVSIPTTEWKES